MGLKVRMVRGENKDHKKLRSKLEVEWEGEADKMKEGVIEMEKFILLWSKGLELVKPNVWYH